VVPAPRLPPLGLRGEETEEPPLQHAVLAASRGRDDPGVAVEAEGGEEGHEDDVGVGGGAHPHGGAGRGRALLGGEQVQREPVLDAVLQVEAAGVLGHGAACDVRPHGGVPGGGLPVEQAEVELGGQVIHEDPQQRLRRIAFPPWPRHYAAEVEPLAGARRGGGVEEEVPGGEEERGGEGEEPGERASAGGGGGHGATCGRGARTWMARGEEEDLGI
jgi:hypothetical protein